MIIVPDRPQVDNRTKLLSAALPENSMFDCLANWLFGKFAKFYRKKKFRSFLPYQTCMFGGIFPEHRLHAGKKVGYAGRPQ